VAVAAAGPVSADLERFHPPASPVFNRTPPLKPLQVARATVAAAAAATASAY